MLRDVLASPSPTEGQQPWVQVTLGAMAAVATVVTAIWARRGGTPDPPPSPPPGQEPSRAEQAMPTTTIKLEPVPTTADGKLQLAEKYVQLLERSQEELTEQLADMTATAERLGREVTQIRQRAEWFEGQARERGETIAYLRALLDRAQVGPRPPLPPLRQEPPTDPTVR